MSPAELWDLFAGLDADGSGDLDGDELGALLKTIGAVSFTHPPGSCCSWSPRRSACGPACVVADAPSRPPASRPTRACAGARLAYHWNAPHSLCSIPFFLTAAAVSRLHGAERRSFGTVSLLSILMLMQGGTVPTSRVARILFGWWLGALELVVHRVSGTQATRGSSSVGTMSSTGKRSGTGNRRRPRRRALGDAPFFLG